MMSKNVPKLRFKDFKDEWKKVKFGKLFKKNIEKNNGKFNLSRTISIAKMQFNPEGNGASSKSLNSYKILRVGDIAFEGHSNKQYKFGRFVFNDIGDGIMSPRFTTLRPVIQQNNKFMKYFIHLDSVMRPVLVKSTKLGTMMNELVISDLQKQKILLPSLPEQQNIGKFFTKLDHLIDLHSQKLEQLKKLKRGYLQKMFPQKGETVPRLRFSGFNVSWKQEKAKKIFSSFSEKDHEDLPPLSITQDQNVLYRDDLDPALRYDSKKLQSYKLISEGDIVIGLRSFIGGFAISDKEGIVSPAYTVMKFKDTPWDFYFTRTYFRSYIFIQSLKKITYGIRFNGKSVSYKDFCTLKLTFPSIDEQKKIGMFFKKMDDKINLQENKISNLNKIKKYYLQKMFI